MTSPGGNEVVIHVRVDNNTKPGFDEARKEQDKFAKESKARGDKSGNEFGEGLGEGFKRKSRKTNDDFTKNFAQSMRDTRELAIPILSGIGVATAPFLSAVLAGAIIGGVGIGGIIGGVALVADDPAIKEKAGRLGKNFMQDLKIRAEPFKKPVLEALDVIEIGARQSMGKVGQIFKNTATATVPFTQSLVRATGNILDGIVKMSTQSSVVLAGMGGMFESVTQGLENFMGSMAEAGPQAAAGLRELGDNLETILTSTGNLIEGGAKLSGSKMFGGIWESLKDNVNPVGGAMKLLRKAMDATGEGSDQLGNQQQDLAGEFLSTKKASEEERKALITLSGELKAQVDPVFGLLNAQDRLKEAQKRVAKSTKDHGKNSRETRAAIRDLAVAAINLEGKAGELGSAFSGKLTPKLRATLEAAGLTKGEIRGVAGEFRNARTEGMRFARTYRGRIEITKVTRSTFIGPVAPGSPFDKASGGIVGSAASGGIRNGLTLVGEHGPELAEIGPGGRVHSNPDTQRMLSQGSGGGPSLVVNQYGPIGSSQQLLDWFANLYETLRRQGRIA